MPFDFKKEYKDFYLPKDEPSIVTVPRMNYLAVRGKGDPNAESGEYKNAISLLYGIAFTIKMSKKSSHQIEGYFDYVVPPLEGFWWQEGVTEVDYTHKEKFEWISLIRLPDFVTKADFESQAGDSIHIEVEIDFHALVVGENAFILVVLELLSIFGVLLRFVNAAELTYILAFLVFGFEDEAFGLLVVGNEFKSALHLSVGQVVAISSVQAVHAQEPLRVSNFPRERHVYSLCGLCQNLLRAEADEHHEDAKNQVLFHVV
jgi:hypothetical protein